MGWAKGPRIAPSDEPPAPAPVPSPRRPVWDEQDTGWTTRAQRATPARACFTGAPPAAASCAAPSSAGFAGHGGGRAKPAAPAAPPPKARTQMPATANCCSAWRGRRSAARFLHQGRAGRGRRQDRRGPSDLGRKPDVVAAGPSRGEDAHPKQIQTMIQASRTIRSSSRRRLMRRCAFCLAPRREAISMRPRRSSEGFGDIKSHQIKTYTAMQHAIGQDC